MNVEEKVFCINCKWVKNRKIFNEIYQTLWICNNPKCFRMNPLTGIRDVRLANNTECEIKNKLMNCSDYEKKTKFFKIKRRKRK